MFSNASFKLNSPRFKEGGGYAASSPGRDAKYRDRRQCKAKAENNLMKIHLSHLYTDIVECSMQVSNLSTLTDHLQHVHARTTLLKYFFKQIKRQNAHSPTLGQPLIFFLHSKALFSFYEHIIAKQPKAQIVGNIRHAYVALLQRT